MRFIRRVAGGAALLFAMACEASAADTACTEEINRLQDFARNVSVEIDAPTPVAGEPIEIRWRSQDGVFDGQSKVYLFVASIDAVRFAGQGFLVYPGGLKGPADVKFAQEWMRAVVPLHIQDNPAAGAFAIKPFREGNFGLSWAVLASTPCGEVQLSETVGFRTKIDSRRATIVLQDLYDYTEPETVIESLDGKYRLRVFDGFYQVVSRETGAKIFDRRGYCPDFSPTGRFVAALTGKHGGECEFHTAGESMPKLEVADLTTGAIVARVHPPVLWANRDAYLVVPPKWWKLLQGPGKLSSLLIDADSVDSLAPSIDLQQLVQVHLSVDDGVVISTGDTPPTDAVDLLTNRFLVDPHDTDVRADWRIGARTEARLAETRGLAVGDVPSLADNPSIFVSHTRYITDVGPVYEQVENPERLLQRAVVHRLVSEAGGRQDMFAGEDGGALLAASVTRGAIPISKRKASGRGVENLVGELLDKAFTQPDDASVLGGDFTELMWMLDAMDIPDDEKRARYYAHVDGARVEMQRRLTREVPMASSVLDEELPCWPNGDAVGNNLNGAWRWSAPGHLVWLAHANCQAIGTVGDLAVNQLDLFIVDSSGSRHFDLIGPRGDLGDAEGSQESPQGNVLRSPSTGEPAKINGSFHQAVQEQTIHPVFAADRFILIPVDDTIYILDHRDLTLVGPVPLAGPSEGSRFVPTADGRHFMQIAAHDGSLAIYEFATGKQVLGGRSIDDELIVFDGHGFYASTREGAQFVHLRFDGRPELYSLAQMERTLHRPDIVKAALLQGTAALDDMQMAPPPTLTATLHEAKGSSDMRLAVRSSSTAGLKEIRLYRDGSLAGTVPVTGPQYDDEILVPVATGAHWLTVTTVDINGLESRPRSIPLAGKRASEDRPKLFAIAVGTDIYRENAQLPRLAYAAADAKRFAAALAELNGSVYGAVEVVAALTDSETLEAQLDAALTRIAQEAGPRDTVMLFFAGHGLRDDDGRFFLATRNTEIERLAATSLSWDGIATRLSGLRSRIFVFLDACHSGSVDQSTNDGAADALIAGTEGAVTVIAASKGRQSSFEGSARGGGYFTTALVSAIAGHRQASIDIDASGSLDLDELYLALKRQVVHATAGLQTPWIARSQVVGKTPMF